MNASIGIIGGADGPTAIFITTGDWTSWIVPGLVAAVAIIAWLFWRRKRK